jgi:hypothetical protein
MREMSLIEQRYKAVPALIADDRTVTTVARDWLVMPGDRKAFPKNGRLPQALAAVRDCASTAPFCVSDEGGAARLTTAVP